MFPNRLLCPWDRKSIPLGSVVLTKEQKAWLIHKVVHHGVDAFFLTKKYSLSAPKLNKWILTYKKTGKVTLISGRPSVLSSPVLLSMKKKLNDEIYNQKVGNFGEEIQKEHVASIRNVQLSLSHYESSTELLQN
jgi:hypothetical protein